MQNVSKFITILHQNFAITQTAFLKPSSFKPANRIVYFLHVFVILGWIACMKTGQEQYLFTCSTYLPCHCRFSTSPVIECITVIITDQLWSAQTCLQEQTRSFAKNISEIWTRNLSNWIVAKLYIGWTILHLETANFWYWFLSEFLWVVTWICHIDIWISMSCYMDLSKLIHEFLLVLTWICQSCHMDLLNLLLWFVLCCFMHFSPRLDICQKFYTAIFCAQNFTH